MSTPAEQVENEVPLNIYQRVNEVRKKVWYVRKDKDVSTGGQGSYKATTHDAVTAMVRNHLIDHGVLIVPRLESSTVVEAGETKNGTKIIRYEAKYLIDFVNCDEPDDKITVPTEAHANDTGDKAPGKAISYATKYAMLKLFNIETGENEESRVDPYEGPAKVSVEQVLTLKTLIEETETDEPAFLEYVKVQSLDEIPAKSFAMCEKLLQAKKRKKSEKKS